MAQRRRRRRLQNAVFTFRTSADRAAQIRRAATREDRLVSGFLRRLVERALDQADQSQESAG